MNGAVGFMESHKAECMLSGYSREKPFSERMCCHFRAGRGERCSAFVT